MNKFIKVSSSPCSDEIKPIFEQFLTESNLTNVAYARLLSGVANLEVGEETVKKWRYSGVGVKDYNLKAIHLGFYEICIDDAVAEEWVHAYNTALTKRNKNRKKRFKSIIFL